MLVPEGLIEVVHQGASKLPEVQNFDLWLSPILLVILIPLYLKCVTIPHLKFKLIFLNPREGMGVTKLLDNFTLS